MTPRTDRTSWLRSLRKRLLGSTPRLTEILTADGEERYRPIDWRLIRRLFSCLRPYARQYALGIVLGLVMILLEMQSPRFMAAIVNWTVNYATGQLDPMPTEASAIARLALLIGLWALVLGVALLLHRGTILIMTDAGERVQFDIRRRLFAHLQALSMSFYDRTKLGRIISRCTSDVNSLREINVWGLDIVAKNALMMVVAAGMLLYTEPRLFAAVVWLGPILFVLNRVYRRKAALCYQIAREGFTRVSANLAENITGARVVMAFNRQAGNLSVFNALQEANTINNVNAARLNGVYQPLLGLIGFAGKAIILIYGGYLVATGRIDRTIGVGSVIAAFLYWEWFMAPIVNVGNFYNQLMMAMAGAERLFNLLDTPPEVADLPDAIHLPPIRGHVRFENVTFGYAPGRLLGLPGSEIAHGHCGLHTRIERRDVGRQRPSSGAAGTAEALRGHLREDIGHPVLRQLPLAHHGTISISVGSMVRDLGHARSLRSADRRRP